MLGFIVSKYWDSAEFKKLQKEWYAKLRKDGFDDIEDPRHSKKQVLWTGEETAKIGTFEESYNVSRPRPRDYEDDAGSDLGRYEPTAPYFDSAKSVYYRRASAHYWHGAWKNEQDREIWRLHSEGTSTRNIAKQLGCGHKRVRNVVTRERNNLKTCSDDD